MPYNQHLNVNVKKRDYKSREMTSCQSIFRSKEAEEKFKEYKFHSLASLNKTGKQGFEACLLKEKNRPTGRHFTKKVLEASKPKIQS